MSPHARRIGIVALALVASAPSNGCQLLGSRSPWGENSGQEDIVADELSCGDCHGDVSAALAAGPHGAVGIACGQCHRGPGHPEFEQPVDDRTCGGCHLPEYQQLHRSAHARATVVPPAGATRADRFVVEVDGRRLFASGDGATARPRLCAACHYDEHRLSARRARSAGFCESCHVDLAAAHPEVSDLAENCVECHMRQGTTASGRTVTSHAFTAPGGTQP